MLFSYKKQIFLYTLLKEPHYFTFYKTGTTMCLLFIACLSYRKHGNFRGVENFAVLWVFLLPRKLILTTWHEIFLTHMKLT